ncbi:hypothetical protein IAR55_004387 [Kwoniella newhampshirensis]|uniref:Rho GTPase activator n=1 Tax=Kwoniella newhampshirensis TaxID=1651941 RepID=A0AAW0YXL7_9TREE
MAVRALPHIPLPFTKPFVQLSPSKRPLPTLELPIATTPSTSTSTATSIPVTSAPSVNDIKTPRSQTTSASGALSDFSGASVSESAIGIEQNVEGQAMQVVTAKVEEEVANDGGCPNPTRKKDVVGSIEPNGSVHNDNVDLNEDQSRSNGTKEKGTSIHGEDRHDEDRTTQSDERCEDEGFDGQGLEDNGTELGHRGYLPTGMDVRDALARCEDPTLGWSLQFWVTIADPLTQHVFFACPASGQCSWDPPVGAFVVPRSPDGEWWELADATRNNRSYYYNTLTGKTQWIRPGGDAFVIPLGLIQRNALPVRPNQRNRQSHVPMNGNSVRFDPSTPSRDRSSTIQASSSSSPIKTPTKHSYPRPPNSPSSTLSLSSLYGPSSQTLEAIIYDQFTPTKKSHAHSQKNGTLASSSPTLVTIPTSKSGSITSPSAVTPTRTPLAAVEESGNETDRSDSSSGGWWERRKSTALAVKKFASPKRSKVKSVYGDSGRGLEGSFSSDRLTGSPLKTERKMTVPLNNDIEVTNGRNDLMDVDDSRPRLPTSLPSEPIYVDSSVKTKRLSTGLHPLLPTEISHDIQNFQGDDFARKYFATKRSGILRQRVPIEQIMAWQKSPISVPLLVISRHLTKDAVTAFKVIQHVMGERDRPVSDAKPMISSSSHLNLASLALGGRKGDVGHPARGGRLASGFAGGDDGGGGGALNGARGKSAKMVVLEEIRWLIQLCVSAGEMRDEVYCQLIKQLTSNPEHDPIVLGFQLVCVLVNAFGPSKNFGPFVKSFLQRHVNEQIDGIGVMAKYCITKLEIMTSKGGRGKALTVGEIEHASDAAFYPSVYGESLDRIMSLQKRSYPSLMIPVILPFLADGILALGGLQSEGIFRVPGDGDSVSELKSRMDRGHYQLKGIDDPHVAASLFKLWLRELEEPIVPTKHYNEALIASRDPDECIEFVKNLPIHSRRVLLFVLSFLRLFVREDVVEQTKMTMGNLALVMAPNILRTTSNSLTTVFTNSTFESRFMMNLLQHMDPTAIDPEYVPSHGQAIGRV